MISKRKLQALRNLAERPGTEAEGKVARAMLDRMESKPAYGDDPDGFWAVFEGHVRGTVSTQEFLDALHARAARQERDYSTPEFWICACRERYLFRGKCSNSVGHAAIQTEIRARFSKGDRVFYNYWAYKKNCPATVVGYVKPKPENGTHPWAWITLKFDHLKSNRQAPIYSVKGWHLSHAPVSTEEASRLARP